jgi:hypothetical protein
MGTFTDNLLKLTEFPFSYSLIGLLAFIIYRHGVLTLDTEQIAPLLILMGFVATTLSMTDPVGIFIKEWLYGFRRRVRSVTSTFGSYISTRSLDHDYPEIPDSGTSLFSDERKEKYQMSLEEKMSSLSLFGATLDDAIQKSIIKSSLLLCLAPSFPDLISKEHILIIRFPFNVEGLSRLLGVEEFSQVFRTVVSLKEGSLRTPWMVREIDKITGMVYFLIVVFVLISTLSVDLILSAHYLDTFILSIRGIRQKLELYKYVYQQLHKKHNK